MRSNRLVRDALHLLTGMVLGAAVLPSWGQEVCPSGHVVSYRVPPGETRTGDAYLFAQSINIEGIHDGDLTACASMINVSGTVTGDIYAAGQAVSLDGTVGDSVRVFGETLKVDGAIDGDLLVFGRSVLVGPSAHITGNMLAFAQQVTMNGVVDGNLKATGGEITLGGRVGKDASLKCEVVTLAPEARIEGDLNYLARKELDLSGTSIVVGRVHYEEKKEKEEEEKEHEKAFSFRSVLWWLWRTVAALLVGLLGLALFRQVGPAIAATVGTDMLGSLGVGFITAIVVPVASVLICLFLITIPLAVLTLFLYLVALYVAKLPVAVWLGQRILRWIGRSSPSPFWGLVLGVPLLYLMFKIPYVGWLLWLVCLFFGLGAIILGARSHLKERRSPPGSSGAPVSTPAPSTYPPASPAPPV